MAKPCLGLRNAQTACIASAHPCADPAPKDSPNTGCYLESMAITLFYFALASFDTCKTESSQTHITSQIGKERGPASLPGRFNSMCAQSFQSPQMVGLGGLEPPASPLSGVRSNHLSYRPARIELPLSRSARESLPLSRRRDRARGEDQPRRTLDRSVLPVTGGASRDRTDDPLLAKQVLSQLSYGPRSCQALSRAAREDHSPSPARERRQGVRTSSPYPCSGLLECRLLVRTPVAWTDRCSKGGDPAAPSDTATLLRLHPSHRPHRGKRPPRG